MAEHLCEAFFWLVAAILTIRWLKGLVKSNPNCRKYRVYENRIEIE